MIEGKAWDNINENIKQITFEYSFQDPSPWERKAANLKYAADRLFDLYQKSNELYLQRFTHEAEADTGSVLPWYAVPKAELDTEIADISLLTEYCLLMGYAIENLLKGLLVVTQPKRFKSLDKRSCIRTHNLHNLCNLCSLELISEEVTLLSQLTDHIVWVAKYPVPLKPTNMYPRKQAGGIWNGPLNKFAGDKTKYLAESFYIRLRAEIAKHIPTEEEIEAGQTKQKCSE